LLVNTVELVMAPSPCISNWDIHSSAAVFLQECHWEKATVVPPEKAGPAPWGDEMPDARAVQIGGTNDSPPVHPAVSPF
jgi:hypothetical protein